MENINTSTDNPARIFLQMLDVVRDGKLSLLQQLATSHAGILQNASQKVDHLLNLAINSRHNHCVNWLLSQYNIEYAPRAMYAAIESQQLEIVKLLLPHISSQIHSLENITPPPHASHQSWACGRVGHLAAIGLGPAINCQRN